ncbi:enoyl-CoA hydratase/isomerase family protein [Billgrantia antri]|uniref:Enoyl-CoA hydratase/isomerase family protein n=1 Tax=Halomonas sulfidivorans TaxID=2733488 RepID=A0ABX7WKC0_9GAMM|nr:enoyl-CoA hydratase-related protein [Halomonas sulfidivorans]QTP60639.1 enoyl-CoA hydratase/isomerase family protein [Halomonas sulfidivorans]
MSRAVTLIREGDCARITLFNPPVNALTQRLRSELRQAFNDAEKDSTVEWILLKAGGRCFSAGADMGELDRLHEAPSLPELTRAIENCEKPCVAWLHGAVLGGGLELAMACHYRLGPPELRLGLPQIALGLIPCAGGTQRLPRLVGLASALRLLLTGETIGAAEAKRLGLVDAVTPRLHVEAEQQAEAWKLAAQGVRRARERRIKVPVADAAGWLESQYRVLPDEARDNPACARLFEVMNSAVYQPFDEGLRREWMLHLECLGSSQFQQRAEARLAARRGGQRRGMSTPAS